MGNSETNNAIFLKAKDGEGVVTLSRNELIEILKTLEGLKKKIQPLVTKT